MASTIELPKLATSRRDDPRVVEEAATEDYSLHVVPRSWRMQRGKLTLAWYGVMTAFFYPYLAAFIALAYGTVNALIGIGLSIVAYTAINAVILRAASRSGLTVALFSRSMFGNVGAAVATAIFAATAIYYVVFEGSVVAVAAQTYIGGPIKLWYAIVVFATVPLVWKGVRALLDRVNGALLPFYVVALVAVVVWALASEGYHGFLPEARAAPGTTLPWLQAFTAYMGVWVLMLFTMDFARLAKPEDEGYHRKVTFGWAFYALTFGFNGLLGILLVSTFGITFEQLAGQESALPVRIVQLTGLLGFLLIVITQMRINTVNLYLASTNLQSFAARVLRLSLPRTFWVLGGCAIAYALMLTNVFSYVVDALAYQGIAIVAWVGVALAHVWYLARSRRALDAVEFRPGRVPAFNPGGISAWVLATAVGLVLKLTDSAGSQFWEAWGLPLTFAIALGSYTAFATFARSGWLAMQRPFDPVEEVDDPWEERIACHACERSYLAREIDRDPAAGHAAICAACASTDLAFERAARGEARTAVA
ncbi:purine-cytosine permease family protein [Conexibacter arvalis]|uniref:Purine-cytosine permease-like protein n=1 Tax=Conexibacter arvalis TaxID=912552 RepID=A0A840IL77_9ACTN|nr:thiamine permease [Conexibacter arvalis]MBB4664883.1 purine-cytosine permease-like protein [Conexibacter arvalis]